MPEVMPAVNPALILLLMLLGGSIVGAWIWVVLRFALQLPILPPNTPRIVPWGWKAALSTFALYLTFQVAVGSLLVHVMTPHVATPKARPAGTSLSPAAMMTASAITNAALLPLIPSILVLTSRARLRDFGLSFRNFGAQFGRGMLAYPLLAPLVFGVMLVAVQVWKEPDRHPLEKAIREDKSPGMAVVLILAGAVCAPLAEELVFRGVLLGWLTRRALGVKLDSTAIPPHLELPTTTADIDVVEPDAEVSARTYDEPTDNPFEPPRAAIGAGVVMEAGSGGDEANLLSVRDRRSRLLMANVTVSFVFAGMHAAVWPSPIPIFFLSLGLGFLYQRTGSIIAPIALHMTFNGVSTVLMFLAPVPPGTKAPEPIPRPTGIELKGKAAATLTPFGNIEATLQQTRENRPGN